MNIEDCRICSSNRLELFLDLGDQPWCNDFITKEKLGTEIKYPLQICFCHNCSTIQVNHTIPKEIMYSDHLYLSGVNPTMRQHFQNVANKTCSLLGNKKGLVVDIGSNDGTLLGTYASHNMKLLGVEPCRAPAEIAIKNGISTDISFFNYEYAEKLIEEQGCAKIISAANVFYHVEELHSIVKGIKHALDSSGIFVMQGSYLPSIMEQCAFDIMYHEHLLYYRIGTLTHLLNIYELEIFDVDLVPVHGGSIIAYVCHKGNREIAEKVNLMCQQEVNQGFHEIEKYKSFSNIIMDLKEKIKDKITAIKKASNTIYAFGAPAKGTVLLNFCNLTNREITCAVEKNKLKIGRYIPCTNIPIVDEHDVNEPDYYLLLSWNFLSAFCQSEEYRSGKRKFIIPIPEPRVLKA